MTDEQLLTLGERAQGRRGSAPRVLEQSPPRQRMHAGPAETSSARAQVVDAVSRQRPSSFFLSGAWLNACLESWHGKAGFRLLGLGGAEPAWALVGAVSEVRHRVLPVRILAVNQSGLPELDQPWIEHNGFFGGSSDRFGEHFAELLDRLSREPDWDELRFGGLIASRTQSVQQLAARHSLRARVELDQPLHWVDLQRVREVHQGDYLAALSANTRQQLRRTRRVVERELGPLRLDEASSTAEALAWLQATAPLHMAQWPSNLPPGYASGFGNPEFVRFHRILIGAAFDQGGIRYLRLRAGDRVLAYLYCFVSSGHVHFYLSGLDYGTGRHLRPGILAHWLAIEHCLRLGDQAYDFLAGDDRYKLSLATDSSRMQWLVLQRPRLKLRLESAARHLKRQWKGR